MPSILDIQATVIFLDLTKKEPPPFAVERSSSSLHSLNMNYITPAFHSKPGLRPGLHRGNPPWPSHNNCPRSRRQPRNNRIQNGAHQQRHSTARSSQELPQPLHRSPKPQQQIQRCRSFRQGRNDRARKDQLRCRLAKCGSSIPILPNPNPPPRSLIPHIVRKTPPNHPFYLGTSLRPLSTTRRESLRRARRVSSLRPWRSTSRFAGLWRPRMIGVSRMRRRVMRLGS